MLGNKEKDKIVKRYGDYWEQIKKLSESYDKDIEERAREIEEKDQRIAELEQELAEKDKEIERLNNILTIEIPAILKNTRNMLNERFIWKNIE